MRLGAGMEWRCKEWNRGYVVRAPPSVHAWVGGSTLEDLSIWYPLA